MSARKQGRPILDAARYPCGHPRTPENTHTRTTRTFAECLICHRARAAKASQRPKRAEALYQREKRKRRAKRLAEGSQQATREKGAGPRKPAITTPAIQAIIEACRPEYLRQIQRDKPKGRPRKAA